MKWQQLLPVIVGMVIAVAGWVVGYYSGSARDREAKRREIRVQYLIEAYRRLEYATDRPMLKPEDLLDYGHDVEKALGDIQLFGTEEQAELAKGVVASMKATGEYAETVTLLKALRADLRQELNLDPLDGPPERLRIILKPQEPPAP
ncbi:MAG TPA: hypothetical protein VM537_24520 [Anaerolineae bacterium]|nr:hypothetical protein [Anaerolineae bacterium]